jgi:DNA polymerase-3 subunit delta'
VAAAAVSAGFRSRVVGQREARARLSDAVRSGRVAHAYLFSGPRGVGKTALALEFAALLLCEREGAEPCGECVNCRASLALRHPDLHLIYPLPSKKAGSTEDDEREFAAVITAQNAALAKDPYTFLRPAKAKDVRISLVRGLIHHASMKPYQARRKVLIVLQADAMNCRPSVRVVSACDWRRCLPRRSPTRW